MALYGDILDLSRQAGRGRLSNWFERALCDQVTRGLVGVYHRFGRKHLQRYLVEILWRWNHR